MPKVSVIILNWNGKRFLKDCLTSLKKVTYQPLEVILVDNNSSDNSVEYVRKNFPWVKLIANKENSGFAGGNNIGAKHATGQFLLFLNNDTIVEPDFLGILIKDFQDDPKLGCVQPQMRVMNEPKLLDEAGAYLMPIGFLYHYGYRKNYQLPQYRKPRIIYSVKGACMLIPRKLFNAVGRFDEDFFIFFEETDLCHRIWLAGYKVIYDPQASIYHLAGGDTANKYNYAKRIYLIIKNMNMSYLQNFGIFNLLTIYPLFLVMQIVLFFYYLLTFKFSALKEMVKADLWIVKHWTRIMHKRSMIQKKRVVKDGIIDRQTMYQPSLYYYYCQLSSAKKYQDKVIYAYTK